MPRNSAQQDLRDTSLKSIRGGLNKLQYLADLRDPEHSAYSHWGLARQHGEEAASKAVAEEHRQLLATLLATPLRKLLEDVKRCSEACGTTSGQFLEKLRARNVASLLPPGSTEATAQHFSSVLHALSELVKHPSAANRRS